VDDNCSYSSKSVDFDEVHGGRWTKEEHNLFLNAIKTYGREVKNIDNFSSFTDFSPDDPRQISNSYDSPPVSVETCSRRGEDKDFRPNT
jgi:hypothetical protein